MFKKYLLGVLSFIPPLYGIFFISFISYLVLNIPNDQWTGYFFPYIAVLHLIVFIINIGMLIAIGTHLTRKTDISSSKKVIWFMSILLCLAIPMPFYWFIHMRSDEQ